ncbi:hypothetical protein [Holdemanella porci]
MKFFDDGYVFAEDKKMAMAAGMNGHISKPIYPSLEVCTMNV